MKVKKHISEIQQQFNIMQRALIKAYAEETGEYVKGLLSQCTDGTTPILASKVDTFWIDLNEIVESEPDADAAKIKMDKLYNGFAMFCWSNHYVL